MNLWNWSLPTRRSILLLLAVYFTLCASASLLPQFFIGGDKLDWIARVLFVIMMFFGAFNFWMYVVGFALFRSIPRGSCRKTLTTRTALVMPVYNEDVARVYKGVRQMWQSLRQDGLDEVCDFYLLSDSTQPDLRDKEAAMVTQLRAEFNSSAEGGAKFFLIRRKERVKYKAGNIANFLTLYASPYDFMLVLDSDSVMLAGVVRRLISRMETEPNIAILQSTILPMRASTPFARMMQFGATRSLPLFSCGLYWFFGPDSVYWGHNALIRIKPFKAHGNLPIMPGKPPLGGEIMSQDIVEAALLRRAGWSVEWDVIAGESFDELPANLESYGKRDHRWCQGNFQHFWLIFADGISLAHRFYFANGIFAYAGSCGVILLAVIGLIQGARGRLYVQDSLSIWTFLSFLLGVMVIPRLLSFVTTWGRHPLRTELLSHLCEFLLSMLLAPSLFYLHCRFVIQILLGTSVLWGTQSRNPHDELSWRKSFRLFLAPTIAGLLIGSYAFFFCPSFGIYLAPIVVGWVLSVPTAAITSNVCLGKWLMRHNIFADNLSERERQELGILLNDQAALPSSRLPALTSPRVKAEVS